MLRLEVGKSYITGSGRVVTIVGFRPPTDVERSTCWQNTEVLYYANNMLYWDEEGHFIEGASNRPFDLIREANWVDKLKWKLSVWRDICLK